MIRVSPPPDGLPLAGPRQGRGHLLRHEGDHSGHSWILRELNGSILDYFNPPLLSRE